MSWICGSLVIPNIGRQYAAVCLRNNEGLDIEDARTIIAIRLIEARDTGNKAIRKMMGKV